MLNLVIILLSVLLQIAAAGFAIRINRTARQPLAWILLSTALVLMAIRRLYVLVELAGAGLPARLLPNELLGLLVSALVLSGILLVRSLFRSKDEQAAGLQAATARAWAETDKLKAVMAATPVPLWIAEDPLCRVIRGNPAAEALLRMQQGANHSLSAPPEELPRHFRLLRDGQELLPENMPMQRATLAGDETRDLPLDLLFTDGEVRHLMAYATPLRDPEGQIRAGVCCMVDLTEIRRVEAALRASESKVQQNVDRLGALVRLNQVEGASIREILDFGLDEAVALTDSALGYIYFYDEAREELTLHSWSRDVMEACSVREPRTTCSLEETGLWGEVVRQRRPILVNDYTAPHSLKKGHPEGHPPLRRFMSVPLFNGGQIVAVVGVGNKAEPYEEQDTEQLTLFMNGLWSIVERRKAEDALAKARKMESLGLLSGGIAHDFNNIFQAMVANLEMAEAALPEDSRGHVYLQRLKTGLDRATRLSRDILHSSGGDLRRPEPLELTALITEALDRLRLPVVRDFARDLPRVMADPLLVGRVVEGLVTNAQEANSSQGVVRVRTYLRTVTTLDLATGHWPEPVELGSYAVLEVSDQGHGIDAATLPNIFDPFYSTRDLGRGLGLPAALGIVRSHHGGLQVESIPGVGSVFRVHFPSPEGLESRPAAPPEGIHARNLVLLADDELDLREVMAEMLESWFGLEVVPATDGQEALETFLQRPEAFDLVILDATMPRMGGVEAFKAMRALRPGLPGILCSGYALPASREEAITQGFADFLKKPFSSAELEAMLNQVMGRRTR